MTALNRRRNRPYTQRQSSFHYEKRRESLRKLPTNVTPTDAFCGRDSESRGARAHFASSRKRRYPTTERRTTPDFLPAGCFRKGLQLAHRQLQEPHVPKSICGGRFRVKSCSARVQNADCKDTRHGPASTLPTQRAYLSSQPCAPDTGCLFLFALLGLCSAAMSSSLQFGHSLAISTQKRY